MRKKSPLMRKMMDLELKRKRLKKIQLHVRYSMFLKIGKKLKLVEAKAMAEKAMSDPMAVAGKLKFW